MKNNKFNYKPITIIFLIITTIILLIYSLSNEKPNVFIQYFSYLYSTFSLIIVILNIKRFYLYIKNNLLKTSLYNNIKNFLYKNKYIEKYFKDLRFRNLINLCISSVINFSFIFIKFIDGIKSKSTWFISLSIYYFLITLIKVFLLNNFKRYKREEEYIAYKGIGYFIMILNIALVIMIIQMVNSNLSIESSKYIIYLTALYSFYLIISALINIIKYRKFKSPLLSSIKVINLLTASVSILMLQTTMIKTFGGDNLKFMKLMNSITGGIISILALSISIYMVLIGRREVKRNYIINE